MNIWNSKQISSIQEAANPKDHVWNHNLSHKIQLLKQKVRKKQNEYRWFGNS